LHLTKLEEVIKPAVQGTVGILESALAHAGPQLESICVISSLAAINDPKFGPKSIITEANWASTSAEKVAAAIAAGNTRDLNAMTVYSASKIAAEKAVWRFRDEHKVSL
jgi:nucleoside-diphosphate-sugar epimerase